MLTCRYHGEELGKRGNALGEQVVEELREELVKRIVAVLL